MNKNLFHNTEPGMSYDEQQGSESPRLIKLESIQIYLNSSDVCELLKVSKVTLWRWRKHEKLPYFKYGRKVLYRRSDIDHFINSNFIYNENNSSNK